jgi:hypothetical protein
VLLSFVGAVWVIALFVLVHIVPTVGAGLGLGFVGCVQIIGQHAAEIII